MSGGVSAAAQRALLHEVIGAHADRYDLEQRLPDEAIAALARAGMLGAQVPPEYGGALRAPAAMGALCADMGYASASALSLLTVHSMVSMAIARWGSREQKQHWLPRLASGRTLGAFALSEPGVGSDVRAVETTIRRTDAGFVVSGSKKWISFAQIAQLFVVVGHCEGKLTAVLIERDTPGLTVEPIRDMLGFRAAMLGQLHLEHCVVPASSLLGSVDFGFSQIVGSVLDLGRYCIAWGALGLAQASVDASLRYTEQRHQFGRPLMEHQLVQRMVADMIAQTQAARLLCADAARLRAEADPGMIMATTLAKYFAAGAAEKIAGDAVQLHGANGCSSAYPVQRYMRDAKILNLIEGSTQLQQVLIAQHGYQDARAR